jgi:hypothetical protein
MRTDERQIRRMMGKFYRPWYLRPLPWVFLLLFVVAAGRVALGPYAERWTRDTLAELGSFRADYKHLEIFSFPPVLVLDGVTVDGLDGQRVMSIERLEFHSTWRDVTRAVLFGEEPTVRLRVARPRVTLSGDAPAFLAEEVRNWLEGRRSARVELASIEDGDILVGGAAGSGRSDAWMSKIVASISTPRGGNGSASIVGKAAVLGSGETVFRLSLPAEGGAMATGDLKVSYLSLTDLYLFLDGTPPAASGTPGSLAVAARFQLEGNRWKGDLRTTTSNVRPEDLPRALVERLRTRLAGVGPWITSDSKAKAEPGELAMRGNVSTAATGQWLKAVSVARAMFVEGVSGGAVAPTEKPAPGQPQPGVPPVAAVTASSEASGSH